MSETASLLEEQELERLSWPISGFATVVVLIVCGGLPGSGKSSIARQLARETGAVWLRIDSIEQAIRESGVVPGSINDAGYRAAYAIAEDNLRLGCNVIGGSVNGWSVTRNAWLDTGVRAGAQLIEVEIISSDLEEHRRRVETRNSEVPRLVIPDWQAVIGRDYEPWDRDHLTIDTAVRSIEDCARLVRAAMSGRA
jgi:predicted kinase